VTRNFLHRAEGAGIILSGSMYAAKTFSGSGSGAWVHPAQHNRNRVIPPQTPESAPWRLSHAP
jgi:hypothetical protein